MFGRGNPTSRLPPPPPPADDDFDEDEPPPPSDDDDEPPFDDFDEDEPPPPSDDDFDEGPPDDDFESAVAEPPDDDPPSDDSLPPPSDDDDDFGPPPSLPSKTPPASLPSSSRPSMEPPSPPESDDDDIPPPPTSSPPTRTSTLRLPVKPPAIPMSKSTPSVTTSSSSEVSGELLNQGLNLNNIPNFSSATRGSLTASLFGTDDNQVKSIILEAAPLKTRASVVGEKKSMEGYMEVQGKFEGDVFETLFIKTTKSHLLVRCSTGDEASFDLLSHAYVFEDLDDPKCFVLEHQKNIIIFKVKSRDDVATILASMPRQVFEAPLEDNLTSSSSSTSSKRYRYPDDDSKLKHVKGTSVEEILQGGTNLPINRAELDRIFSPRSRRATIYANGRSSNKKSTQRRKELINSHIKKPVYSVRRVKQLCQWINSLNIWSTNIDIMNLHKQFCNGLLLAKLMKYFIPSLDILHLNEKALAEKPAVENIEKVLGCIWRSKSVNNSRIPKANEIFEGNVTKIVILLCELFDVYVRKPLCANVIKIFKWYTAILRQYDLALPLELFIEGNVAEIWSHFQSGSAVFCVIYHFFGPVTIGSGSTSVTIDPLRITFEPRSISEFRANISYIFNLLRALNIEVFWEIDDWITHPDTEFIMLQLSNIYEMFKDRQCSLPPAQGSIAGVTSGPNGEPRVVGLIFADTLLSNRVSVERMARTVLLGTGEDALPLLPIDNSGLVNFKFYSPICPQGLLSFMSTSVKILHATVALKESLDMNRNWNPSSLPENQVEKSKEENLLNVLRSHNKRSDHHDQHHHDQHHHDETFGLTLSRPLTASSKPSSLPVLSLNDIHNEDELVEVLDKQYHNMLQTLEDDMKQSKHDYELQEDDLAARYAELEAIADRIHDNDYNRIITQLDNEKKQLELDNYRLKEHYKLRLTSIKVQRQETFERFRGQLDLTSSSAVAVGGKLSKSLLSSSKSVTSSLKAKTKTINKEQAEKGWVSISAKNTTHNIHLHRMQSQSMANNQTMWTPHKYRTQKSDLNESKRFTQQLDDNAIVEPPRDAFAKASDPSLNSNVAAFNRFRERLHVRTEKWFDIRDNGGNSPKRAESTKDYQNSPVKSKKPTLISVPSKSDSPVSKKSTGMYSYPISDSESDEKKDAYEYMSKAIRDEELMKMKYEDERRTKYLNQLPSFSRRKSTMGS